MISRLVTLPMAWLIVVVLSATYLVAAVIYLIAMGLASGERVRAFTGLSPAMLPRWASSSR
jgi:Na+/H+-dicarboxylate symporter